MILNVAWLLVQDGWSEYEDWENVAWSYESWFLWHLDGRVRIWCKQHESMDPSCFVSAVQAAAGGEMVWEQARIKNTKGPLFPFFHLILQHTEIQGVCILNIPDYNILVFFNCLHTKSLLVTQFLKPDTQTPEPHTKSAKANTNSWPLTQFSVS